MDLRCLTLFSTVAMLITGNDQGLTAARSHWLLVTTIFLLLSSCHKYPIGPSKPWYIPNALLHTKMCFRKSALILHHSFIFSVKFIENHLSQIARIW